MPKNKAAVLSRTKNALRDSAEIWSYIALHGTEARATKFVDGLDEKCRLLASHPGLGCRRDELADGIHSFPVGRYVIFYRPVKNGVTIVRILHGSRDIDGSFFGGSDGDDIPSD